MSPLRASSDHSPSSFSLEGGLDWSPTVRSFFTRPPTDTPRRAINPGEGLPRPRVARAQETIKLYLSLFQTPTKGSAPGCPLLRASDEHILIVRVLRARRTVWLLPSHPSDGGYPLLNFSVYAWHTPADTSETRPRPLSTTASHDGPTIRSTKHDLI